MFMDASNGGLAALGVILILAVILAAYFLPTLIAWARHHRTGSVALVNLLVGWSFIGWIAALLMAMGEKEHHIVVTHVNPPIETPEA